MSGDGKLPSAPAGHEEFETMAVAVGANGPDGWRVAVMMGGRVLASFDAGQARALGADLIRLADLFEGEHDGKA